MRIPVQERRCLLSPGRRMRMPLVMSVLLCFVLAISVQQQHVYTYAAEEDVIGTATLEAEAPVASTIEEEEVLDLDDSGDEVAAEVEVPSEAPDANTEQAAEEVVEASATAPADEEASSSTTTTTATPPAEEEECIVLEAETLSTEAPTPETEALNEKEEETETSLPSEETVKEEVLAEASQTTSPSSPMEEELEQEQSPPAEANLEDMVVQSGPLVDLLGDTLLSLKMIDETQAELHAHYTNEVMAGKAVIGLYFSADWCGPCRQFTPDLVNFYDRINNSKRGFYKDKFEIVWISRCRSMETFGQYFTQMGKWYAMQPELAMGPHGEHLMKKYNVKGIPTLVLVDEIGSVITTDARQKIPQDKMGIGFPWRNPLVQAYLTLVPKSLRLLVKSKFGGITNKVRQMMGQTA